MEDIDPHIPEYEILIINMIKDLFILSTTMIFPNKDKFGEKINKEKYDIFNKTLLQLDLTIFRKYKYTDVINCVSSFMKLFDFSKTKNIKICELLETQFVKTPYILFPSFHMLDFYKINISIGVPIIIFQISNKNMLVHRDELTVCKLIHHDICFHNKLMKIDQLKIKDESGCGLMINFKDKFGDYKERFEIYFDIMNKVILSLQDDITYNSKDITFKIFKEKFIKKEIPDHDENFLKYLIV